MIHGEDGIAEELEKMFGGKATEEQKAEALKRRRSDLRRRGVVTRKGQKPLQGDDWKAFKAQHFGK